MLLKGVCLVDIGCGFVRTWMSFMIKKTAVEACPGSSESGKGFLFSKPSSFDSFRSYLISLPKCLDAFPAFKMFSWILIGLFLLSFFWFKQIWHD